MILRSSSYLGISLGDRSLSCAELTVSGGKRVVRRVATFHLPSDFSLDKPDAAGAALAAFLRKNKFSDSRAVVGIPAKWMIAIEKELPPAGEEQSRSMLRLQAERLAVSDSGEMAFDYAGDIVSNRPNKVLLVGVLRQRLDRIEKMCDVAGVGVAAITSTALTLAKAANESDPSLPMLMLSRQGAEMVWRHEGAPRLLRHVAVLAVNGHGPVTLGPVGSEVGRALALTRANGSAAAKELLLWDAIGLSETQRSELAERSGVSMRDSDTMSMLDLSPSPADVALAADDETGDKPQTESFAPAISLAAAGFDRDHLALDFTRSRLTPRRTRKVGRQASWAIAGGAVLALAVLALYVYVSHRGSEMADLKASYDAKAKDIQTAQTVVDRVDYTKGFFDARPPVLETLLEITNSYRDADRIWTTSLSVRDEEKRPDAAKDKRPAGPVIRKCQLQGKANDSTTVYTMLDRMRKDPKFSEVKLLKVSDAGGKTREVLFSASFNYIAPE